jgi:hypothetical protein
VKEKFRNTDIVSRGNHKDFPATLLSRLFCNTLVIIPISVNVRVGILIISKEFKDFLVVTWKRIDEHLVHEKLTVIVC